MDWKRAGDGMSDRIEKMNRRAVKGSADLLDRVAGLLDRVERTQTEMTRDLRKRMQPRRRSRGRVFGLLLLSGLAGFAAAYLLDPEQGNRRRAMLSDRLAAMFRGMGDGLQRQARSTSGMIRSMPARMAGPDNPNPDDNTLVDRVESELFADPEVPKGKINIGAVDGKVILRGELEDPTQISSIEMAVRKIVGVRDVENLMHPAGTPAPTKAAARQASGPGPGTAVE
jgi:osmotically-inducible protein OsmY